jgi:multidrug efflux pump subunit AcrA (membrane-fusion protein)
MKLIELETRRDQQAAELTACQKRGDAGQEVLVREALSTLAAQIEGLREEQARLTVRAPESGMILTAAFVRAPSTHRKSFESRPWHGHPSDEQNLGCHVEKTSHLFTIAPTNAWDAVLVVEQADCRTLEPGDRVEVKLDAFPGRVFAGQIRQIASRHEPVVPESLSSRYGGTLPTVTGPDGKELLRLGACRVRVELDADHAGFRQGMRGTARLAGEERTVGRWILWCVQRTFLFGD